MTTSLEEQLRSAIERLPALSLDEVKAASARLDRQHRRSVRLAVATTLCLTTIGVVLALVLAAAPSRPAVSVNGPSVATTTHHGSSGSESPSLGSGFLVHPMYGPVTGIGSRRNLAFVATGTRLSIAFWCSGRGAPELAVDGHPPTKFASCRTEAVDGLSPYLVRSGSRVSISVSVPADTRWELEVGEPRSFGPREEADSVALAFAHALGNHACGLLPALSTVPKDGPSAAVWTHLCENASPALRMARVSATLPFSRLKDVSGAVEITISTGNGSPTPFGPLNLSKGMTVVVGQPKGYHRDRVLVVPEPRLPALGQNYGWTFH